MFDRGVFGARSLEAAYYALGIFFYGLAGYMFYKIAARNDLLVLNLNQYNRTEHPVLSKIWGMTLHSIEFAGFFPVMAFVWFTVYAAMLALVAPSMPPNQLLLVSVGFVSAVRFAAYIAPELAVELGKLMPLAILGTFVASGTFEPFARSALLFTKVGVFLDTAIYYFLFFMALEVSVRLIRFLFIVSNEESV